MRDRTLKHEVATGKARIGHTLGTAYSLGIFQHARAGVATAGHALRPSGQYPFTLATINSAVHESSIWLAALNEYHYP